MNPVRITRSAQGARRYVQYRLPPSGPSNLLTSSNRSCGNRMQSSSSGRKDLPPPLPPRGANEEAIPDPRKAKQEYLKAKSTVVRQDPIARMAELQKELDIVRERAAEKLEKQLQKTVYQRLTDPLRRHHHSVINVGAVLLAYILAHNLHQTAKRAEKVEEELKQALEKTEAYQASMKDLLTKETLEKISQSCVEMDDDSDKSNQRSSWPASLLSSRKAPSKRAAPTTSKEHIFNVLQFELKERLEEHLMTEEEKRIRAMQKSWSESQVETPSPQRVDTEQALLVAVLRDDSKAIQEIDSMGSAGEHGPKKIQKRVFSM